MEELSAELKVHQERR